MTTGGNAAARWACAGTDAFTALPVAVALAGATTVTLVTFVILVMFVTLVVLVVLVVLLTLFVVLLMFTRMPTATTGGALVTTAGLIPIGAGMMIPNREPGGAGMKTPLGPMGGGPGMTPGPAISTVRCSPGAGATHATPGGDQ